MQGRLIADEQTRVNFRPQTLSAGNLASYMLDTYRTRQCTIEEDNANRNEDKNTLSQQN